MGTRRMSPAASGASRKSSEPTVKIVDLSRKLFVGGLMTLSPGVYYSGKFEGQKVIIEKARNKDEGEVLQQRFVILKRFDEKHIFYPRAIGASEDGNIVLASDFVHWTFAEYINLFKGELFEGDEMSQKLLQMLRMLYGVLLDAGHFNFIFPTLNCENVFVLREDSEDIIKLGPGISRSCATGLYSHWKTFAEFINNIYETAVLTIPSMVNDLIGRLSSEKNFFTIMRHPIFLSPEAKLNAIYYATSNDLYNYRTIFGGSSLTFQWPNDPVLNTLAGKKYKKENFADLLTLIRDMNVHFDQLCKVGIPVGGLVGHVEKVVPGFWLFMGEASYK